MPTLDELENVVELVSEMRRAQRICFDEDTNGDTLPIVIELERRVDRALAGVMPVVERSGEPLRIETKTGVPELVEGAL